VLTDAVSYLSQLRDQQQTQSEREKKRPKRGGEGAVTDAAVTDSAVAAADLRGGLLSSRELFCVELVVDPGDSEEHATMAALGESSTRRTVPSWMPFCDSMRSGRGGAR